MMLINRVLVTCYLCVPSHSLLPPRGVKVINQHGIPTAICFNFITHFHLALVYPDIADGGYMLTADISCSM